MENEGNAEHHAEHHSEHIVHHSYQLNNKKKIWFFIGLGILIIAAVIALIFAFSGNKTTNIEKYNVSYVLTLSNGSDILTGNSVLAADGLASALTLSSNKINSELTSMGAGQEKTITLAAVDAFGEYDSAKNITYDRTQKVERKRTIDRKVNVTLTDFTDAFNEQPIAGKTYTLASAPWDYKVLTASGDNIELSIETTVGADVPSGLFGSKVIAMNDTSVTLQMEGNNTVIPSDNGNFEVTFDNTYVYFKLTPTIGQTVTLSGTEGRVIGLTSDKILIDSNNPYAGQTITVKLKLENKFTEKISSSSQGHIAGAPTMQVFIMSHCPYGTQMVKGILPVWEKFKNKANIELRFVSYTMHGAQEDLDNNRIICVREEQNSKLLSYLNCFVSGNGDEASSQKCITQTGVDKTKLDSCVSSKAATYMETDKTLNTQYSVQGSPTVIIDGKEASIYPRDPQSVATALCNAFTSNKPSECSLTFSTTNPDPGFGTTSGSSSGSGSCS